MANPGLAAVQIGKAIGASSQEVNRLLSDQGFIERVNGAWALTKKGLEFGIRELRSSSNLPQARSWDVLYWSNGLLDVLDTSSSALSKVRTDLRAERLAMAAARRIARAQADAAFRASQALPGSTDTAHLIKWLPGRKALGLGAGGLIAAAVVGGAMMLAPAVKRSWDERHETARPTNADADLEGPPEPSSE